MTALIVPAKKNTGLENALRFLFFLRHIGLLGGVKDCLCEFALRFLWLLRQEMQEKGFCVLWLEGRNW